MSDPKKYLGMIGHHIYLGDVQIVAVQPKDGYFLLRVGDDSGAWEENSQQIFKRFCDEISMGYTFYHLPITDIFKDNKTKLSFCWVHIASRDWAELLPVLHLPVKKIYVKDLEDLAELEQAKKAQESAKRSTSNQWRHQRHEAARAILGVRKSRW